MISSALKSMNKNQGTKQEIIDQIKSNMNNLNLSLERQSQISSVIGQTLSKSFKTLQSTYKLLIIDQSQKCKNGS